MTYGRLARRRPEHAAAHVDDWLMTYADMITLLLCFFAIFLAVTVQKKSTSQPIEVVRYMPLPAHEDFLEGNLPLHGVEHADHATQDVAATPPAKIEERPQAKAPPTLDISSFVPPEILSDPKPQANAPAIDKGNRITTLEMSSAAFFDSGSATLSKAGEAILRDIAVKLGAEEFRDYQITVEGHTDDAPISTVRFPSNWELSTARASAVVHFFLDAGIPAHKLRAAGYADTFPKAPNRDAAGNPIPQNQALNRRVVIRLDKIEPAAIASAASNAPVQVIPPAVLAGE